VAAKPDPGKKLSPSTIVAASFVAAAGLIAWYGTAAGSGSGPDSAESITLAASERPAAEESYRTISRGGLPTRIVVQSAGVDADIDEVGVVLERGRPTWETAWQAAGHHFDSALPGQPGNMVISGHVSVADRGNLAVFQELDQVAEGDVVEVYSGDEVYRYAVSKVMVVSPTAVKLLRSDSTATVTLITCTEDLKNRLVVVGTLV